MINRTTDEYKKLMEKSRRSLSAFLKKESDLSEATQRKLFGVISKEFKSKMNNDDEFCAEVERFCSGRRSEAEKDAFYFLVMKEMVGGVKAAYADRYPDEYSI